MKLANKSMVTKGVFAVAVVAITATVGVIGFAQAAPRPAAVNGYGIGAQILAAIQEFQKSLQEASQKFQQDIANCLAGARQDMNRRGLDNNPAARAQFDAAAQAYRGQTNGAIAAFSAQTSSPGLLGSSSLMADNHLKAADDSTQSTFTMADNQLASTLDRLDANRDRQSLNACIREARNDYHQAVQEAREKLLETIRNILGR